MADGDLRNSGKTDGGHREAFDVWDSARRSPEATGQMFTLYLRTN